MIELGAVRRLAINVSPMSDVARTCTSRSVTHLDKPTADTANRLFVCSCLHGWSFPVGLLRSGLVERCPGNGVLPHLCLLRAGQKPAAYGESEGGINKDSRPRIPGLPGPCALIRGPCSLRGPRHKEICQKRPVGRLKTKPNALPPWVGRSALFSRDGIDKSHPAPSHSRPIAVAGDGHLIAQRYGVVLSCVILN